MENAQTDGLFDNATFELIPMKNTLDKAADLPEGATVSVTASPDRGMEPTVALSLQLVRRGFHVIPHLSARAIKTKTEAAGIIGRLGDSHIDQIFVVGGDADNPGDFFDALELLAFLDTLGHPFARIGVTGYPEGHPSIDDARLLAALLDKLPHASYIATQMCFDAVAIENWIRTIRSAGVHLPISLGVPGAVDGPRLLTIGTRIGVGQSLRYLRKNRRGIAKVLRGGTSPTDRLLATLAPLAEELGINSLHIFTFNAVADTTAWWQKTRLISGQD